MSEQLPAPVGGGVYDVHTGQMRTGDAGQVPAPVHAGLEPPRFCATCGRRMVVQVRPDGWWSECSRHGRVDSEDLEPRR